MLIPTPKKLKADDYLQELSNQDTREWLKSLIANIVLSRKIPDEPFLARIYEQFLTEHNLKEQKLEESQSPSPSAVVQAAAAASEFGLKSLHHESGVNALERGATISFHPKLTVMYGKNGSGKSGFVRILKRIAGSRTQEDVWQNLHNSKTQNQCKATIYYTNGGKEITYPWKGESKIGPFTEISVFDGKCVSVYLNRSLAFSYQPLGFDLFPALSSSLQRLQQRLTDDIKRAQNDKPQIEDYFSENTSVGKFVRGISAATKLEDLDRMPSWDAKAKKDLADKTKERKGLNNLDQQAEVLQTRQQKLEALEEALTQVQTDLSAQHIKVYFDLIRKFNQLKKKQSVKKGKTLKDFDIPEMESNEWEQFVEAGENYIRVAERAEYPNVDGNCIYCQQKLSKGSQKLIQLYRELYQETETSNIDDVESRLDAALSEMEGVSFVDDFPYSKEDFKKLLRKRTVAAAFAALASADSVAHDIAASLKGRKRRKLQPVKTSGLIESINKVQTKVETQIKTLASAQRTILSKSRELERTISELEDTQKLAKHVALVKKHIVITRWTASATALQASKLSTKPVTDLGKKAWRELVSDSFKACFQQEAANLHAPGVDLEFRGEYGSQMRAKNLEGLEGIDRFLSEGEQKAVALADFFAELSMQPERAPVIFDDPATSFDHDRKEKIAKRIVVESAARQIIVFTHDLMFASYLHEEVEKENNEIDPAKAAFHDLQSESGRVGVVTQNYYRGSVKFDAYIKKVDTKVAEIDVLTGEARENGIRNGYGMLRRAVEQVVEERIFGKVITRWSDQIQMHNTSRATLNREKLDKAKQFHEEFSRYIVAHNQSDEMMQHASPDLAQLKSDLQRVRDLAVR